MGWVGSEWGAAPCQAPAHPFVLFPPPPPPSPSPSPYPLSPDPPLSFPHESRLKIENNYMALSVMENIFGLKKCG